MDSFRNKALPALPENGTLEVTAPPPLHQRPPYSYRPSLRKTLSWCKNQIDILQEDNIELRQEILIQQRRYSKKDRLVSTLQLENAQLRRQLAQRDLMAPQLANAVTTMDEVMGGIVKAMNSGFQDSEDMSSICSSQDKTLVE